MQACILLVPDRIGRLSWYYFIFLEFIFKLIHKYLIIIRNLIHNDIINEVKLLMMLNSGHCFHSQLQPLSLIFLNFLKNLTKVTKPMHKGVMSFEEIPFRLSFLLNNIYFECMGRGLKRCSLASENRQKHHRHVKLQI